MRGTEAILQLRAVRIRRFATGLEVDGNISRGDATRERQDRLHAGRKFRRDDSQRVGLASYHPGNTAVGMIGIHEGFLEGRLGDQRRRQPDTRGSGRLEDFHARGQIEGAPPTETCRFRKQDPRPGKR